MKTKSVFFDLLQRYFGVPVFFIISFSLIALPGCGKATPSQNQIPGGELSAPSSTSVSTIKVDLLYFHQPQRCVKCLCFERRVNDVVIDYFQDEIDSGQLTFQIINIANKENYGLVQKYGAVGSQLFINIKMNGQEHIKDIQEIWAWECTNDTVRFDTEVKNIVEQSLAGEY